MLRAVRNLMAGLILVLLLCPTGAQALTLTQVGGSFEEPIYVTSDPGDASRLFVVERKGRIWLVQGGVVSEFADLRTKVGCGASCEGETGLMSIALAPGFEASGRLYVDYAEEASGEIRVEEMTATGPAHETASVLSLKPVIGIPHADAKTHYGGQLQFGPEGNLFVSTGDGGGANDQFHNAQRLDRLLGKIIRVSPNGAGSGGYAVPAGNPFPAASTPFDTIWAYGLRNPFRFSFDRLGGAMTIADVGQAAREEVDLALAPGLGGGANYGWNCREGLIAGPGTDLSPEGCATTPFVDPVLDYGRGPDPEAGGPERCAIIGGYVARDPSLGGLYGRYLYADNCSGAIRAAQLPATVPGFASGDCWTGLTVAGIDSFGEDAAGRLYAIARGGQVYRLGGLPLVSCPATEPPVQRFTVIGIRAERRRVLRGKRAVLTVFVSPCQGRRGQVVRLLRNGRPNGSRYLDRACTAHFLPRVRRGTVFRAAIREEGGYPAAESRRLKIRIDHRRRARRR